MPDNPLTSEAEPSAPSTPESAADEAAPHYVSPPDPEPAAAPEPKEPPPAAVEPPPTPEPVAEEAPSPEPEPAAPPEPPNPQPLAPAAHVEEEPEEDDENFSESELAAEEAPLPSNKRWYVVKVQSGREETIKEAIERRVKIERLEEFFGQIIIPVERVTELRRGKRVVKEKKLYPGYLMAEVEYNDRILYLFRETSGVGDFVGGTLNRPPPPMSEREVQKMLGPKGGPEGKEKEIQAKPPVERGDRVKVRDGTFAGMEGEVKEILETLNHLRVELTIFGRPVPVELEYWQVESV